MKGAGCTLANASAGSVAAVSAAACTRSVGCRDSTAETNNHTVTAVGSGATAVVTEPPTAVGIAGLA